MGTLIAGSCGLWLAYLESVGAVLYYSAQPEEYRIERQGAQPTTPVIKPATAAIRSRRQRRARGASSARERCV